jgi:hypothetical protein
MKDNREKEVRAKRPYIRPEVKKVQLRPEEAVLGGCKTTSGTGPAAASCGFPSYCSIAAS